jgi:hypothetical protein
LLIPIYVKLFNCIFDSGKASGTWLSWNIIPIFKNKEKSDDPKKYRPISILSCLGKLFTSILNKTIKCLLRRIFVDQRKPSRLRHGYSTNDNIFPLHSLFELLTLKKKMFCVYNNTFWKSLRYCLERGFMV